MGWKFRTYVSQTGRSDVQNAIDSLREPVREHFAVRVRYLANTPRIDWRKPQAKKLQGVQDIYEIRFKAANKQYRPLGYFGPEGDQFTILIWATKKDHVYDPAEAIGSASRRRKDVVERWVNVAPLTIDGEEFPPA